MTGTANVWTPDSSQQSVIDSKSHAIRVVGLAGSGKTVTLARRFQKHIGEGADPTRTLIIAFDDSGKRVLTNKLRELDDQVPLPIIDTLDDLGGRIFRELLGNRDWQIDHQAADQIAERIRIDHAEWSPRFPVRNRDIFFGLKAQGFYGELTDTQRERAAWWLHHDFFRREWALDDALSQVKLKFRHLTADQASRVSPYLEAFAQYERALRENRILGREDRRIRALEGLRNTSGARRTVQESTDHIVVDECQDLNRSEVLLIGMLLGPNTSLLLAGDDDQTVHAYREARSVFLRQPKQSFKRDFETIELQTNYRCPAEVLDPATSLIRHNIERIDKHPRAARQEPGFVHTFASCDTDDHDREIATQVQAALTNRGEPGELAILVESVAEADRLSRKLADLNIPTFIQGRYGFANSISIEIVPMRLAKGREWKMVIIPSVRDASFPGSVSRVEDVEEARRLLYMAMTRCSSVLVVGFSYDQMSPPLLRNDTGAIVETNGPSRFLHEAGLIDEGAHPQVLPHEPEVKIDPWDAALLDPPVTHARSANPTSQQAP